LRGARLAGTADQCRHRHRGWPHTAPVEQIRCARPRQGRARSPRGGRCAPYQGKVADLSPPDLLTELKSHKQDAQENADSEGNAAQGRLARVIARNRAPTKTRLKAQVASRLNQLRDTNLRPR